MNGEKRRSASDRLIYLTGLGDHKRKPNAEYRVGLSLFQSCYRCSQNDHNIMITLSVGSGTSYATRRMVSGSEQLFYNLYRDAARQVIWGDGTGGTQAYLLKNPQGNNQDISLPIFGLIQPSQNVGVGSYSDTITVSLNF